MKLNLIAFISLGFACGGPEMGSYGEFTVDLTDDEKAKIDEVVANDKGHSYHRVALKSLYPEIDAKIVEAASALRLKVIANDALSMAEKKPRCFNIDKIIAKSASIDEAIDTIGKKLGCDLGLDLANVCYYLSENEIPADYKK